MSTQQALKDLVARDGESQVGLMVLASLEADIHTPPEVRRYVAALFTVHKSHTGAAAVVYEAAGFRSTVIRSVITAINLTSRIAFPSRVYSDIAMASHWIGTKVTGAALGGVQLSQAIVAFRQGVLDSEGARTAA